MQVLNDPIFCTEISNIACSLISCSTTWKEQDVNMAGSILEMANIAYNNTSADITLLDDGIYDQLLVIYKKYNPNYQVGSYVTPYQEIPQNEVTDVKVMCTYIDKKDIEEKLYLKDLPKCFSSKKRRVVCHFLRSMV